MTTAGVYGRSRAGGERNRPEVGECGYMACPVLGFPRHSSGQLPHDLGLEPAGLRSHLLLRPTFEQLRTSRGELQPVLAGYARLSADGNWIRLDNGALTTVE